MTRFGVLGSGVVGQVLADGLLKHGYEVMRGSRELAKLESWRLNTGSRASIGSFAEAAAFGETIVLAVKGLVAESALELAGVKNFTDKVIIDATNPIADSPPINGVLSFFTGPNDSLMERLQSKFPNARFVKAFSCVGNARMVNPNFDGLKPTMFTCGDDANAKELVANILRQFGWDVEDMGGVEAARAIEPLCMLWCIPGLRGQGWDHAFKLLRS